MNPILILTHNNLDLTKRCVESVREQDIETNIFIVDNGSSDQTVEWSKSEGILLAASPLNTGFSAGVNFGLNQIFDNFKADYCLCTGSDTVLPPHYYRSLLEMNLPVVSGVQDINGRRVVMDDLEIEHPVEPVRPNPDFSSLLWRKEAWKALGGLDASMTSYCSDCDAHIRAHYLGIGMFHVPHLPFFHEGSSTIRFAPPKERRELGMQADLDRLRFAEKWGHREYGPEYESHFLPENFGIDKNNP